MNCLLVSLMVAGLLLLGPVLPYAGGDPWNDDHPWEDRGKQTAYDDGIGQHPVGDEKPRNGQAD